MWLELLRDNANETCKDGRLTSEFDINGSHGVENKGMQRVCVGALADEGGAFRMEVEDGREFIENTLPN